MAARSARIGRLLSKGGSYPKRATEVDRLAGEPTTKQERPALDNYRVSRKARRWENAGARGWREGVKGFSRRCMQSCLIARSAST